ncbi:hypothetical protein [Sphingobium bisphenolivorans]|uniref:hypothetical protein n=1 Tax=Sphingobium bisphenolivorans TaxID=1335760 RepID=UPI0003A73545|nr:hypothetical protein [Sphingobium bisphenolivorans]
MTLTLNNIVLLGVALLIGLVLGLMLSGRGKYKRLWRDEQMAHQQAVQERDARLKDREARLNTASERLVELERQAHRTGPGTVAGLAGAGHPRDDLSRIRGITSQEEAHLHEAGYHSYAQLAGLSREEEASLEAKLGLKPGVIADEQWREQAALLNDRKDDEHRRLYDRPSPA